VVHQVREETIENLEGCVDLDLLILVNERKEQVEQVLPHEVLLLIYGASDLNQQVANLMDHILVAAITDRLQELVLHEVLCIWRESLPQVLIVSLVACILRVERRVRDVSSQDDRGQGLHIGREHRYRTIGKRQIHSEI